MSRLAVTLLLVLISATPAVAAPVAAAPPANVSPPLIDDTSPAVGDTLHASGDTWDDPQATVTYQWRRCDGDGTCADIQDATGSDYAVVPADARSRLVVRATATNGAESAQSDSQPTEIVPAVPPQNTTRPSISGTPRSGQTLTAQDGSWSGTSPTVTRQWLRCDGAGAACGEIAGATGPTLDLGAADEGHTVRVRETASNGGGQASADSDATALVPIVPVPVSSLSPPLIAGSPAVGSTLISSIGQWGGTIPIVLTRRWQRCPGDAGTCADIPGRVSDTYTVQPADVGHSIRIVVRASNDGGTTSAASALLGPVTTGVAGPAPQPGASAPSGVTPLAASFSPSRRADLARALQGRLKLRAICTGPCRIVMRLTGSASVARKWRVPRTVATGRRTLAGAGTATVRPRFAKATRRRLRPVRKLVVVVTAQARDGAGKLVAKRSWKLTLTR